MTSTYEQLDSRNVATYPVADAARYLAIPAGTLRLWLHGRTYPTANGNGGDQAEPLSGFTAPCYRCSSLSRLVKMAMTSLGLPVEIVWFQSFGSE